VSVSSLERIAINDTHMKNPATLPIASIRAAQAVPEGCSKAGSVSTTRARSTAITEGKTFSGQRSTVLVELTCVDRKVDKVYR
jgi:hypothetical protein